MDDCGSEHPAIRAKIKKFVSDLDEPKAQWVGVGTHVGLVLVSFDKFTLQFLCDKNTHIIWGTK